MLKKIPRYFPELEKDKLQKLEHYKQLLNEWNQAINLVSRKDMENLEERHLLHSLAIAKAIRFVPSSRVLDIGTGGGLPGIPLAILFPDTHFHLIDSIAKKIKAVESMADELGLENVLAEQRRAETLKSKYDFITARAVTASKKLIDWGEKLISGRELNELGNGFLLLKGGQLTEELQTIRMPVKVIPLSDYFEEDFFNEKFLIHISKRRNINHKEG